MERNSLTFWTSFLKGRLGGAACSPVSDGSSDLEKKQRYPCHIPLVPGLEEVSEALEVEQLKVVA